MSWTKSGTVSVTNNSATVYGAGTTWASAKLARAGDIFKAPDGRDYEVANVQSNTQLTLTTGYLGTTASAQAYALIHTGLLPAELAVGVSDLQSKYLATVSQLYEWETSAAATVPMTNPATGVTSQVKPLIPLTSNTGDETSATIKGKLSITTLSGSNTGDQTAATVPNTPAGGITESTVQAALNGLETRKAPLANPVFSGSVGIGVPPTTALDVLSSIRLRYANPGGGAWIDSPTVENKYFFGTEAGTQSLRIYDSERGVNRMYLDATGFTTVAEDLKVTGNLTVVTNALIGYGPGAGGTVTQQTSKSTAVTCNHPCGLINMNTASLAPGASVAFVLNNTLIETYSSLHLNLVWGLDASNYSMRAGAGTQQAYVVLKNESAAPLAEAVQIIFSIGKVALS